MLFLASIATLFFLHCAIDEIGLFANGEGQGREKGQAIVGSARRGESAKRSFGGTCAGGAGAGSPIRA